MWVIRSTYQVCAWTDNPLYWSTDLGWVGRKEATVFGDDALHALTSIPLNSEWVNIDTNERISYKENEKRKEAQAPLTV